MMGDGYEPWIAIAPEGKIPVRAGDSPGATNYSDAWAEMPVGVDTKAPLSDFYGPEVIDALTAGTDSLQRWAIPQGQGDVLGAIQGEQPVANAVNEVSNGTPAEEAASAGRRRDQRGRGVRPVSLGRPHGADAGDEGGRRRTLLRRPATVGPRGPARTAGRATC